MRCSLNKPHGWRGHPQMRRRARPLSQPLPQRLSKNDPCLWVQLPTNPRMPSISRLKSTMPPIQQCSSLHSTFQRCLSHSLRTSSSTTCKHSLNLVCLVWSRHTDKAENLLPGRLCKRRMLLRMTPPPARALSPQQAATTTTTNRIIDHGESNGDG
jgi:hypothetical protein